MILDGSGLTIEKIIDIAREGEEVALSPEAQQRIMDCRKMIERKLEAREIMYGVNTGIGDFSETPLTDEEASQFQKYLVYNHAAGIGDPAPGEYVRAAMASRINVHCHGNSAMRLEITKLMVDMLNRGVIPYVCQKGSVGASGDLAPMSQIALVMMGEAQAWFEGELLPGGEALRRAGLEPVVLKPRDGLSIINGSNLLNAMNAIHLYDMNRWLKQAEIAAAMTLEALNADMKPYDVRVHEARGFPGAIRTARALNRCIDGSALLEPRKKRVQDAYSMRSTPQVIGAAHDALSWARRQVEIELNGVGDNPIFLPEDDVVLTGANFQGSPVSLPMDMAGIAITMVSVMSERRLNRVLNVALSEGLPPFLAEKPGLYSGHMLSQYTACSLIVEQRMLSTPAACASIPAAADQEDFVSMGMNTAIKNGQILENAHGILGIELIAAADGLQHRGHRMGRGSRVAFDVIRKHVDFLGEDRPLFRDHTVMAEVVKSCEILDAVEAEVGSLE